MKISSCFIQDSCWMGAPDSTSGKEVRAGTNFLIQNSSFWIQNSSWLMQNSSLLIQNAELPPPAAGGLGWDWNSPWLRGLTLPLIGDWADRCRDNVGDLPRWCTSSSFWNTQVHRFEYTNSSCLILKKNNSSFWNTNLPQSAYCFQACERKSLRHVSRSFPGIEKTQKSYHNIMRSNQQQGRSIRSSIKTGQNSPKNSKICLKSSRIGLT